MTIVGVTDEPAAKIKPYITDKDIKYVIALGGASEYKTDGIPHSWLVDPKGSVVWEGHPAELKETLIEEHIKGASLLPQITLPKELRAIEKDVSLGNFGAAIKALETHLKKPKSAQTEAAAKEALEKLRSYGTKRLEKAEESAKEKDFLTGLEITQSLEKVFKGHEMATKAKDLLAAWKKDKASKLELDGAAVVQKAEALIEAKQYANAKGVLLQVAKAKKYDGTKIQAVAQKRFKAIEKKK